MPISRQRAIQQAVWAIGQEIPADSGFVDWYGRLTDGERQQMQREVLEGFEADLLMRRGAGTGGAEPLEGLGPARLVSQVLPVIVQCLVAGPGALVVLEQPELHLHPAAQQRLADFFLACTAWGQNLLVESHAHQHRWPDGFFDQGADEAHQLLIASAAKQRRAGERSSASLGDARG